MIILSVDLVHFQCYQRQLPWAPDHQGPHKTPHKLMVKKGFSISLINYFFPKIHTLKLALECL